jgi:hydroxyethylthiazole kinase
MGGHEIAVEAIARAVAGLRERRPRVHCITNSAAVNFTANVLLAAGAIPSMTVNPEEIADFVAGADGLLINLGTLDPLRREAIDVATAVADEAGKPWALDPVFVERSPVRLRLARRLVEAQPTLVRSNQAELAALTASAGDDGAADALALASLAVVVRTGATDFVTDGARRLHVAGGHHFQTRVTAAGCAATALMAGFLAVEGDAIVAAAACLAAVAAAAEAAGAHCAGPGSFVPAFIDALYRLTPDEVGDQARIS